jgi:diguanylate cyclase (GGDEF)-like protein/PAS domain S-box-containing protein
MLDTVKVPKQFEQIFQKAEEYVSKYFKERKDTPSKGTIEIFGERYILVRAASMSVDFFEIIKDLYKDRGEEEAHNVARQFLFDIAHAIGKQDAKNFHNKMKLKNPVEKLSAGPIHFSYSGWAFVDIFPESRPTPDENYYLIYDHPFSFESDAWEKAGKKSDSPVCVMNAGYSSGWCEESFGVSLVASEIMCRAKGDDACRFIMAHPSKLEAYIKDYLEKDPGLAKKIINYEIPGFFKRKEMEKELRRAHNELEIRVKERTAELTAANAQQKKSKARLIEAQRIAHLGNWDWDIEKNELSWSDEIYRIFGFSPQEFGGSYEAFLNIIHPEDREFVKQSINEALSGKRPYSIDHRIVLPDGTIRIVHEQGEVTHDKPGKPIHMVGTVQDITERKQMEEKLQYFAYYDAITGLPNRNLFVDRLNQVLTRASFHKNPFAVLIIDIDDFKSISDTFGFNVGDNVLKEVAGILSTSIREGDTVARLGGDDFGVLLTDIAHSKDVILVVEKIMKNVSQPIKFDGKEIILTLSMGISVYPGDGEEAPELTRNADLALSKAKQRGRKTYQFYTAGMNEEASEFVLMEGNLFNALKNEEFILYYQPYWEINTKKLAGMEALIRWQKRDFGLVCPRKFIPVLEKTKMIIEVGEWILKTACRQVMEWHDKGQVIPVSINVSPVQFMRKDLPETLERIIKETGVDPKLLTMEITESTFMHNVEFTSSVLKKLKDIGVSISIDDFGTGYSSLSYLKRFPIDNLKIDISFIREIANDPDSASIVTAIISMAHSLNLKTIAEGVETEEQWKILRLLRCHMGQGYLFSPPLPAKEAEKLLT